MSDQINVNAIADTLNSKVQLPDGVGQDSVDFVVETQLPTAENNYTWYRLYKSGWVEQGGFIDNIPSGTTGSSVVFSKEFSDTHYSSIPAWGSSNYAALAAGNRTTTGMKIYNRTNDANWCYWEAKGMSAQGGNQ